jgi:hypothetical protein
MRWVIKGGSSLMDDLTTLLTSYLASSCGGARISIVHQYIEQQKTPD